MGILMGLLAALRVADSRWRLSSHARLFARVKGSRTAVSDLQDSHLPSAACHVEEVEEQQEKDGRSEDPCLQDRPWIVLSS